MSLTARVFFFLSSLVFFNAANAQPSNDACSSGVINLSVGTSCTTTSGSLYNATTGGPSSSCGTAYDVWYSFTVPASSTGVNIDLSSVAPTNLTSANTFFQVFTGTGCSLTAVGSCSPLGTTLNATLTAGQTYMLRVHTTTSPSTGNANKWDFDVCISNVAPPSNDECTAATTLSMGSATSGTVWQATTSTVSSPGCATGTADDDVWYKFTATSSKTVITLSSVGTDLTSAGTVMQLFSGSCASLSSLSCTGTTTLYATGLTVGSTYYVRVYSSASGSIGTTSSGSAFTITASVPSSLTTSSVESSRMNEVFQQTIVSAASVLNDPWEVAYGPDGFLWVTEAKGYKVYRIDPSTGVKITVLDVSQNSKFLPSADQGFNVQFSTSQNPWPQGGFAGMALHPKFLDPVTPKNYVYVSYVHSYVSTLPSNAGVIFTNRLVRFTYNTSTGKLESPVSLCDTLPGSSDHNSQRIAVAPVAGTDYLFYASGDMGAGQYTNLTRELKAQNNLSYEGKILRFNLEADNDAGLLDKWIPSDNPLNSGSYQSAVWAIGIRNNQGFASVKINGVDYLYGSSHGPFSDDEINIIEKAKNYGHPLVIGFNDGNYDGAKAGPSNGSAPAITLESSNAAAMGTAYRDPIYSFYPAPKGDISTAGTIQYIYNQVNTGNGNNSLWPSEAPSGMEIYQHTLIPGWKNSILQSMLKGGRIMRLKLNAAGTGFTPTAGADTVTYFRSVNRFRDVAVDPDGKTIYAVIDKSSTTSGPTTTNPLVSACAGCLIKYTFLGYNTVNNRSNIPTTIGVSAGVANSCTSGNTITIDATNNNLWVPITGPDGDVVAEIKANGNNLGLVTSSFYSNSGAVRETGAKRLYLDRNITITPQNQPSSAVSIRLYFTAAEFLALKNATNSLGSPSGISSISDVAIFKNNDACSGSLVNTFSTITPAYAESFGSNYVVQASISSFSSFYIGNPNGGILPVDLLTFEGSMKGSDVALSWKTEHEKNASHFEVERSLDGISYSNIGIVTAAQNNLTVNNYDHLDQNARSLPASVLHYRLKIVDGDGSYNYSRVVSIGLGQITRGQLFPNPASDRITIKLANANAGQKLVEITDLHGRTIYKTWKSGTQFNLDVSSLSKQVYMVRVWSKTDDLLFSQKFQKL